MKEFSRLVRRQIIETGLRVPGVHFGGCFSVVEILLAYYLPVIEGRQSFEDFIKGHTLILSKGHCGLAVYSVLKAMDVISQEDFESYCQPGGRFNGHIQRDDSLGIGWSTGSLGHGLSVGMGMAAGGSRRVCVILGDGELNEGQCWEAFIHLGMWADRMDVVIDNNGMMSLGFTADIRQVEPLNEKFWAFGIEPWYQNGHDIQHVRTYFDRGGCSKQAVCIAYTVKGFGLTFMENQIHWHTRSLTKAEADQAIAELA